MSNLERDLARKQYVAAIMRQEAEDARRVAVPMHAVRRRRLRRVVWVLVPVFLGLSGWNAVRSAEGRPPPPAEALEAEARVALLLAASAVEAYRESTRALPASLAAVGLGEHGVAYREDPDGYVLTATAGDTVIVYHERDDLASFGRAYNYFQRGRRP